MFFFKTWAFQMFALKQNMDTFPGSVFFLWHLNLDNNIM